MADPTAIKMLQQGCGVWKRWPQKRPDISPDLSKAKLRGEILSGINFDRTCLDQADFRADLSGAQLRDAWLHRSICDETLLQQTNFYRASLLGAAFLPVDLSKTSNLDTVAHPASSTIDVDTIQRSRGKVPDVFLRGVGVSEQLLTCLRSSGQASFDYATCDLHFVNNLYEQLRAAGVFCWFAPESLKAGEKFPASIPAAIERHEKVLMIISKASLKSEWVEKEVQLARQKDRGGRTDVLLPIRLDSAVLTSSLDWAVALRKQRNIRSFENWQQSSHCQKCLLVFSVTCARMSEHNASVNSF